MNYRLIAITAPSGKGMDLAADTGMINILPVYLKQLAHNAMPQGAPIDDGEMYEDLLAGCTLWPEWKVEFVAWFPKTKGFLIRMAHIKTGAIVHITPMLEATT